MSRRKPLFALILSTAASLCFSSCKKEPLPPKADSLTVAIKMQGGVNALRKASSFTARYEGTLLGSKITGTITHKAGATRLKYMSTTSRYQVFQVASAFECWQQIGRAVVPCNKELTQHSNHLGKLLRASWLWPLAEHAAKIKSAKVTVAGKVYEGLTVPDDLGGGTLLLDEDYVVVGLQMKTTLMGKSAELIGTFSKLEQHCGIKMPTVRSYTFDGKPFAQERIIGMICQENDDKLFERPKQVKHGLTEIRHTFDTPLACMKLKGPLSGVRSAMDEVIEYLGRVELRPQGAALLYHHKGPPSVKKPEKYVTDVCFPVSKKAWTLPKSTWTGTFFQRQISGDEVLVGYGVGGLDKTAELAKLMIAAGRKQGRKKAGVFKQVLYMRPGDFPAEQIVTEMHMPLD